MLPSTAASPQSETTLGPPIIITHSTDYIIF